MRRVVRDRDNVLHLLDGPAPEAWFQPIKCGGGVAFPGAIERAELRDACPDCKRASRRPAPVDPVTPEGEA